MPKFSFDSDLCTKCHACEVVCALWHDVEAPNEGFRRVIEAESGQFPHVKRSFESKALPGCDLCQNAGGPRCARTCPTGALRYE